MLHADYAAWAAVIPHALALRLQRPWRATPRLTAALRERDDAGLCGEICRVEEADDCGYY